MWMTRISIRNPVFATMVMVALCVLGLFSYWRLGVEPMPDINPPVVMVEADYPGASPTAVATDVTRPVEEGLNGIAGVRLIRSASYEGHAEIMVEFGLDADTRRILQDVRDRAGQIQGALPKDVRPLRVSRMDNDNANPTVSLALLSPSRSNRELSLLADQVVRKRFERVEGVARIEMSGLNKRQVRVNLDPQRLRTYGVTPAEISAALARQNIDAPVGVLKGGVEDVSLRVEGKIRSPQDFAKVVVAQRQGLNLTLGDLGRIEERENEVSSLSRINGEPALSIRVFKQQDANVVKTGEAIKEATAELQKALPHGVELRIVWANSDWVKDSLDGVKHTLVEGALLTIAIVFLFLHSWRSTVITGLTLPISIMAAFIAVYAFGFTLNFMTLLALSLSVGLLIDDAIVVRENIVRHLGLGKSHVQASQDGTDEIGLAVMATTFALCAVFVPVAFMKGMIGKFFFPFGVTVAVAVLVSLFVSFTLDPMLSSVWPDPPSRRLVKLPVIRHLLAFTDRCMDGLHRAYERTMRWAFSGRSYRLWWPSLGLLDALWHRDLKRLGLRRARISPRGLVLGLGGLSLVGSLALAPLVGGEAVPETDQSFTALTLRMPVGTSLARASEKVGQIEQLIKPLPEIETITSEMYGAFNQLYINLKPVKQRSRSQKQVEQEIRDRLRDVPGIDLSVGFNRPINVAVLGPDPVVLDQITSQLADKIRKVKGVADLESSVKPGVPAFAVRIRPDALKELGLSTADVAASLRAYVNGDIATFWQASDGQQLDVEVRLAEGQRKDIDQLKLLPVGFAKDGTPLSLDRVADLVAIENPSIIRRQNLQLRQAIYASVHGRSVGEVNDDVQAIMKATELPNGYSFDVRGASKDMEEMMGAFLSALALSVVFIYIVLASQFGSFQQPLAIMVSLPLALIGVMLALALTGSTLNIFSMIGLIMLMGLVTKNAILLVDFANQRRKEGLAVAEALLEAGLVRMRPIMMTTAAMVFGMLPLALALNEGAELQSSMGRAIIGGVITSTLLTLVVVPVVYSFMVRGAKPLASAQPDESPGSGAGVPGGASVLAGQADD